MVEPIQGKVIRIIGPKSLIVDVGENDGVSIGMRFVVFDEGDEIRDPDTGESLGKLEFVKAEVQIEETTPRFSIAVSLKRRVSGYETQLAKMFSISGFYSQVVQDPLPIDPNDIYPIGAEMEKNIKLGDKVRQRVTV